MNNFTLSTSPHIIKKGNSTKTIMLDVLIAMLPAVVCAIIFYGYHVVINIVVCMLACFGIEMLYDLIYSKDFSKEAIKKSSAFDFSCLVTGVLIALNLPTTLNVWGLNVISGNTVVFSFDTVISCVLASAFAIVIIKKLFGGIGKNFINPAMGARVFLFVCFGTAFVSIPNVFDASTGATWLSSARGEVDGGILLNMLLGLTGSAAVGETCAIAILVGYAYLVIRKVIDFSLPLTIIGSTAVFAFLFDGLVNSITGIQLLYNVIAHVLSGGLLFGAVFMATDYATSPNTTLGRVVYGIGIGLVTVLIRCFAGYPEGMSFAILIMNVFTPVIDKIFIRKPFGYVKEAR